MDKKASFRLSLFWFCAAGYQVHRMARRKYANVALWRSLNSCSVRFFKQHGFIGEGHDLGYDEWFLPRMRANVVNVLLPLTYPTTRLNLRLKHSFSVGTCQKRHNLTNRRLIANDQAPTIHN